MVVVVMYIYIIWEELKGGGSYRVERVIGWENIEVLWWNYRLEGIGGA